MSTADTVKWAFILLVGSIVPLMGMLVSLDRHPVLAWLLEGLFVIMAGTGVVWLMLVFYVNVVIY